MKEDREEKRNLKQQSKTKGKSVRIGRSCENPI